MRGAISAGGYDRFLDVAQAILAEENFVADVKGRRAKGAALDGTIGVVDQLVFHRLGLDQLENLRSWQPRFVERRTIDGELVHLFRLSPHVAIHLVDVALE